MSDSKSLIPAVLRQNVAWFDATGAGEVTTRIQTDTHLIQEGISDKVGCDIYYHDITPLPLNHTMTSDNNVGDVLRVLCW